MNKTRFKRLKSVLNALDSVLFTAIEELNNIKDDEQEAFDNSPESLQNGEKGERMTSCIDAIDSLVNTLESAQSEASDITNL